MRGRVLSSLLALAAVLVASNARAADGLAAITTTSNGLPAYSAADDVKMKALESEVDSLKKKIFNSKAKLLQLQETVLHGAGSGAMAKIHFTNSIGKAYRLDSATWVLDGQAVPEPVTGPDVKDAMIFDGAIMPGTHNLSVTLVFYGNGYDVFKYLEGYRFTVQSTYPFQIEEGKTTEIEVTAVPKEGLLHAYEDRLDMKFQAKTTDSVPLQPAHSEATP